MRRLAHSLFVLTALAAMPPATGLPVAGLLTPTLLAQDLGPGVRAAVDSVFLDLDRTDTPGCAVGVIRDGALVLADGYGSANLDHEIAITPATVFYMGSVSKQFTAAAVALAARRGHLSLDDDIRKWVPEIPDYGETITVRNLVHHTSGIRDYLTLLSIAGSFEGVTDEQVLELLGRQRALNFGPGERYLYSNSGYFLLSEILERATGLSLREFADREFFAPLGLRDTHFHDRPDHIVRNRATGYAPMPAAEPGEAGEAPDRFRMNHAWGYRQVGAGGLYSSVSDMARLEAAFEAGRVGGPGFRESLLERGVLDSGDTLDYAFGLSVSSHRGLPTIAHGGSLAGFRSQTLVFPDQHTSVLVFCNVTNADPGGRATRVAELVLGDRLAEKAPVATASRARDEDARRPPPLTAAERGAYVGEYHSEEMAVTMVISVSDDGLVLGRAGRYGPLRRVDDQTFTGLGARLAFQRDSAGRVTGFILDAGRANGMVFKKVGTIRNPGSRTSGKNNTRRKSEKAGGESGVSPDAGWKRASTTG